MSEASYLDSGFATYARECLARLHAGGEVELCELGCMGGPADPRAAALPWRFVANEPADAAGRAAYLANPLSAMGSYRFERTCLEFRPDVVWTYRDWWYDEFVQRSPFRGLFHWAHMATVDAEPQDEQWLDTFASADGIFTYTQWGADVLRRQTGGRLAPTPAPPGADLDVFRPVADRAAHQLALGLPAGSTVVGTCNRNQPRKLFPDLIEAFAAFLARAPEPLKNSTYLYLHTTFPDVGWDLPRLVRDSGVGRRILFTYLCRACRRAFPSHYRDARTACRFCGRDTAFLPQTAGGVSREALAGVFNAMDFYVQYATSEGFGLSQVEAAACGVPVLAVDYSAMGDVVRKVAGRPIKVQRLFWDAATGCRRALPDNADLVAQLLELAGMPKALKERTGRAARAGVERHFTYERTAAVWAGHFRGVPLRDPAAAWAAPSRAVAPKTAPDGLSDADWVRWHFTEYLGRPDLADSFAAARLERDLHWGQTTAASALGVDYAASVQAEGHRAKPFDRAAALKQFGAALGAFNDWEAERVECAS